MTVLLHAQRAKVIGLAAASQKQRVVANRARSQHLPPGVRGDGTYRDFARAAVYALHGARQKPKPTAHGLRDK